MTSGCSARVGRAHLTKPNPVIKLEPDSPVSDRHYVVLRRPKMRASSLNRCQRNVLRLEVGCLGGGVSLNEQTLSCRVEE